MYYTRFNTPVVEVILVGDENGLTNLHLNTGKGKRVFDISEKWQRNDEFFEEIKKQILEYFANKRQKFEIELNPQGTEFQKKVWEKLTEIPFGEALTYLDIAKAIGNPKAVRAVGNANSKNPIPLIVPCHRVIGKSGKMVGFAHGLDIKEQLLKFEGAIK